MPNGPRQRTGTLRIVIVTDVRLYQEGLGRILHGYEGIDVVGVACPAESTVARIADLRADVLLVDSRTAVQSRVCAAVTQALPHVRVVAFAVTEENADEIVGCAKAGVSGFVARDASVEDLARALRKAAEGLTACSDRITGALIRGVAALPPIPAARTVPAGLTRRERQIIERVDDGLSNKEIADQLGISVITVKNHVHNVLGKLSLRRRGEAAAFIRHGAGSDPSKI